MVGVWLCCCVLESEVIPRPFDKASGSMLMAESVCGEFRYSEERNCAERSSVLMPSCEADEEDGCDECPDCVVVCWFVCCPCCPLVVYWPAAFLASCFDLALRFWNQFYYMSASDMIRHYLSKNIH